MKNKFYYILLGFIVSFSFINNVFAVEGLEFTVSAQTDNTDVVVGSEATINVSLKSDVVIKYCQFKLESDENIEFVDKNPTNLWNFEDEEGSAGFIIRNNKTSENDLVNGKNIFQLKYKINGSGKVTIKTVQCVSNEMLGVNDKNEAEELVGSFPDISVNFTSKVIPTLSSVVVTGGTISPNVTSNSDPNGTYYITLDSPNFSLDITPTNSGDSIVVKDASGRNLDPSNIIYNTDQDIMPIYVTVNDVTTYMFGARYEQQTFDNSLSSLKIAGVEILQTGVYSYEYEVPSGLTKVKIEAILSDSTNFKFKEGNGPSEVTMNFDEQTISIIIEPKNTSSGATSKEYIITLKSKTEDNNKGDENNNPPPSNNNSNNNGSSNNVQNPQTGGISMFIMAVILISSLVGSIFLYQKNLQGYN